MTRALATVVRTILVLLLCTLSTGCRPDEGRSQPSSATESWRPRTLSARDSVEANTSKPTGSPAVPTSPAGQLSIPVHQTDSLFENLLETFRLANARLSQLNVLERRSFSGPGSGSIILARAIRADQTFSGDFTDEMFGVFRTSADGNKVKDVITYIPTPRWNDFTYRFEVIDRDSIVLWGTDGYGYQGASVIRWQGRDVSTYVRPEDPWPGAIVQFVDTLEMNLYDRPEGTKVPVVFRYEGHIDYGMQVQEAHGSWFKVVVWVPSDPGCANDLDRPLTSDTLWTPLELGEGRRLLRRAVIAPC